MAVALAQPVGAESLRGSRASLDRQNRVAREHDFTYLSTPARVRYFVSKGWLVRVQPNRDLRLRGVSFPYARPELAMFLQRLGAQYHAACGRRLVITSLTRPLNRQPRNASDRSVHPTGMAVDLRYSRTRSCRAWLERVLLSLERAGVLEATRERRPIHYHVALFPRQYRAYVDRLKTDDVQLASAQAEAPKTPDPAAAKPETAETKTADVLGSYTVRSGDSLWTIARAHGTTVRELRNMNELRGSRIRPGQVLAVSSEVQVASAEPGDRGSYTVRSGDSLWMIARSHGTTVGRLRRMNDLRGNRIMPGQVLEVPQASEEAEQGS